MSCHTKNKKNRELGMDGKRKERLSSEYTILSILEYLCVYSKSIPISKYHMVNKIPGINQQRFDRINNLLEKMEQNGFIESRSSADMKFYLVTEKGEGAYYQWVKSFLDFSRVLNKLDDDRYMNS
jgi:DNA-binding PadR family transcriptional regulator